MAEITFTHRLAQVASQKVAVIEVRIDRHRQVERSNAQTKPISKPSANRAVREKKEGFNAGELPRKKSPS